MSAFTKTLLRLLLLASFTVAGRCHQSAYISSVPGQGNDGLSLADDGTAIATGIVLENNQGCRVDASCYLQLKIKDKQARVIYHPGESEVKINESAYRQGATTKKGAHVKVYGRYRKSGNLIIIETYSSEAFFIHVFQNR